MRGPQLYVYYRVRPEHRRAAVSALQALHADWMRADPALRCELMERVEAGAADRVTLMEVYSGADAAEQQRREREASAAVAAWLDGSRHTEVFAPCA